MKRLLALLALLILSCTTTTSVYPVKTIVSTPDNSLAYRSVTLLYIRSMKVNSIIAATGSAYDKDHIITAGHFCINALERQIFESHMQSVEMRYYDHEMIIQEKHNLEIEIKEKREALVKAETVSEKAEAEEEALLLQQLEQL